MEFKNLLSAADCIKIYSDWKNQGLTLITETEKAKILSVSTDGVFFLDKKMSPAEVARIQYPGHLFELEGSFEDRFFRVQKAYKINRRETFRVDTSREKAQASFNYAGNSILAKVKDLSMEGLSLVGPPSLINVKTMEMIKDMKIIIDEVEVRVDFQVRRVLYEGDGVKLGGSFYKVHTVNGSGLLMNFINRTYRNQNNKENL